MQLMDLSRTTQSSKTDIQQHNHYQMLVIFKSFFAMLAGDYSLNSVGEMTDALIETPAFELTTEYLKRDPACAALIRDRYIPQSHDLDLLLTYPKNSLGYIYAATMKTKGFDPNLHAGMTPDSDAYYVEMRLSQTHDLWHIVTGFDTSAIGELGLQAFHWPQFSYPLATMLIANGLISTMLLTPEVMPELLEAIMKGWQMGKIAKPLFAQKWEEMWDKPLAQIQQELNIQPIEYESQGRSLHG